MRLEYGKLDNFDYERMAAEEYWIARSAIILLTSVEMESKGYFDRDDRASIYWKVYGKCDEFVISVLFGKQIQFIHIGDDEVEPDVIEIDRAAFRQKDFLNYLASQQKIPIDTELIGKYLAGNSDDVVPLQIKADVPTYNFSRQGEKWLITYEGKLLILDDSKGISYIHELIKRPQSPVPADALHQAVNGVPEETVSDKILDEIINEGEASGLDRHSIETLLSDKDSFNHLIKLIQLSNLELDEARSNGAIESMDKISDKITLLNKLKNGMYKPNGEAKNPRTSKGKITSNVSKEYYRALERLEKYNRDLSLHLRQSITTGSEYRYNPSQEIDWSFHPILLK